MALELSKKNNDKFGELKQALLAVNQMKDISPIELLTLSDIFCPVSKERRRELTKASEINPKLKIDVHIDREFKTEMGHHVIVSGPLLSYFDASVASTLIAIYMEKNCRFGSVRCGWTEIARKLGKSTTSVLVRDRIHRSLTRMKETNIKIYSESGKTRGIRSLIQDLKAEGSGQELQLVIQLNEWIVPHYKRTEVPTTSGSQVQS